MKVKIPGHECIHYCRICPGVHCQMAHLFRPANMDPQEFNNQFVAALKQQGVIITLPGGVMLKAFDAWPACEIEPLPVEQWADYIRERYPKMTDEEVAGWRANMSYMHAFYFFFHDGMTPGIIKWGAN